MAGTRCRSAMRQHVTQALHPSTRFVPLDRGVCDAEVCTVLSRTLFALGLVVVAAVSAWIARRWADRAALRAVHRFGARVNRFKLTRKPYVRDTLLANGEIAEAVGRHASEHGVPEAEAWRLVRQYIDEIVPFFNILAY